MRVVRPGSDRSVRFALARSARSELTYEEVGASLGDALPSGYHHVRAAVRLGAGEGPFERAVAGLRTWVAHRKAGTIVLPVDAPIDVGTTVLVAVGAPALAAAAPCRIVGVVDEPHRWGFAYGTLRGHPEQGEESFVVSIDDAGEASFEVTAFSRPGGPIARLAGPLGRAAQRRVTDRYLRALASHADPATSGR